MQACFIQSAWINSMANITGFWFKEILSLKRMYFLGHWGRHGCCCWFLFLVLFPCQPIYTKREQVRRILFIILKLSRVLLTTLEWNNNTNHLPTEGSQPLDLSSLYSWHRAQHSQKKWGTQLGFGGWGRSIMFRCLVLHVHDIISGIPMKQFIPCRFIEYHESHRLRIMSCSWWKSKDSFSLYILKLVSV